MELPELAVTAFDLYFAQPPRPVHKVVAVYLKEKDLTLKAILQEAEKYTVLEELLPWNSFFVHLLENYPWEAFQKFWNFRPDIKKDLIENVEEAFYQAYGKSFSELEKEGRNRLEGIPFEREWIETVERIDEIVDLNRKIQAEPEEFSSSGVQIKYADFPQLRVDVREFGPYAVPIEPSRNLEGLQNKRTELRELYALATDAIKLSRLAQDCAALKKYEDAYCYFHNLRANLIKLNNTTYLPWVDKNLEELKGKVPPELVRSLEEGGFPWWGWALIGCGAAGVLGLGGWLFVFKRRAHQKGKGQQP